MRYIDLRSDTVTQPTEEMRKAMFEAEVGDDVYGDDPTVLELERLAAEILGKEAALFVPSGTMGNQLAVMTHTRRGDEIILSDEAHVAVHEGGAAAMLSGVMTRQLSFPGGIPDREMTLAAVREKGNVHYPVTRLLVVECPLSSGKVVPVEVLREVYALAKDQGIMVHMDGARIFNAAEALGVEPRELAAYSDSVMVCLSKGLCAPVGSMLLGSRDFIEEARRNRKMLGGGMRQAGFLAAAGIISLTAMVKRLKEDHENAKYMARELGKLPGITLDYSAVEINMVFFQIEADPVLLASLPEKMLERGVKMNGMEDGVFRFVTSNDVSREDIDQVLTILREILA